MHAHIGAPVCFPYDLVRTVSSAYSFFMGFKQWWHIFLETDFYRILENWKNNDYHKNEIPENSNILMTWLFIFHDIKKKKV